MAATQIASGQEIQVSGGSPGFDLVILSGDTSPRVADGTDFGTAAEDGGTVDRTFRVQNLSAGTSLALFSITENSPDFSVIAGAGNPNVPAGGTHDFTVRFAPGSTGVKNATISIDNNDPTGGEDPYTFAIRGLGEAASGTAFVWTGGAPTDDWHDPFNWSPLGVPDVPSDTATVNLNLGLADAPELMANETIGGLTLSNGADVSLGTATLSVQGNTLVNGATSTLHAGQGTLDTDFLFLQNGGDLSLLGGTVEVDVNPIVGDGCQVIGFGTFRTNTSASTDIVNDGTFRAESGTLTVSRIGTSTSEFDWDGTDDNQAAISISSGATLDIDMPLADAAFNGSITLNGTGVLDTTGKNWGIDGQSATSDRGTLTKQGTGTGRVKSFLFNQYGPGGPGQPGSLLSVLAGTLAIEAETTLFDGTATVSSGATLQYDGPLDARDGTIMNSGRIVFNDGATIDADVDFQMIGSAASLTVGPGSVVSIFDASFDLDALRAPGNVTTIESGGRLNLHPDDVNSQLSPERFGHTLNLNGGMFVVNDAGSAFPWEIVVGSHVNANSGESRITGDVMALYCDDVNVASGATLILSTAGGTMLESSAHFDVASGGMVVMEGGQYLGASFAGAGTLRNAGSATYGNTTIDIDTFDWDGDTANNTHSVVTGATLTVNSPNLNPGGGNTMSDRISLRNYGSELVVNGPAAWIKDTQPIDANLFWSASNPGTVRIAGSSRLILRSTLNVLGDTEISAPFTLDGGTISVAGGTRLETSAVSAATVLDGGSIEGAGDWLINANTSVVGATRIALGQILASSPATPLEVESGGTLDLAEGVIASTVPIVNDGILVINDGGSAHLMCAAYQQGPGATLQVDLDGMGTFDHDFLSSSGMAELAGTLEVEAIGGFVPTFGDSYTIVASPTGISGEFAFVDFSAAPPPAGLEWRVSYEPNEVVLSVIISAAGSSFEEWIGIFPDLTDPADKTKSANPDDDALDNFGEFALDGDPSSGEASGKYVGKVASVGGEEVWTLTFPVRLGAVPAAGDPPGGVLVLEQASDGVIYTIRATDDLMSYGLDVSEVMGADATAIQAGLPLVNLGWEYRSFRSPGPVAGGTGDFMNVVVSESPSP